MRCTEHEACMRVMKNAKHEGKEPNGRERHRWENCIKMDLIRFIWLTIIVLWWSLMNMLNEPSSSIKLGEIFEQLHDGISSLPVWAFRCSVSCPWREKILPHSGHSC
jgi:hypothetical protein